MRRTGRPLAALTAITIAVTCFAAIAALGSLIGGIAHPVTPEMGTVEVASSLAPTAGHTDWTQSVFNVTILASFDEEDEDVEAEEAEEADAEEEREGVFDRLCDCVMLA